MSDNLEDLSLEFLDILKYNRSKLKDFLIKYNDYDLLKNILYKLEIKETYNKGSLIRDLFMGKLGYENNKQMAIYNIPTKSLINSINSIIEFLGIEIIHEVGSGLGLLSSLINNFIKIPLVSTDGYKWLETSSNGNYYSVIEKDIFHFNQNDNNKKKLYIFSWFINNNKKNFIKFIENVSPSNLLLLNDESIQMNELIDYMEENNYCYLKFNIKTLCYKDYFDTNIKLNKIKLEDIGSKELLYLFCKKEEKDLNESKELLRNIIGIDNIHLNNKNKKNSIKDLINEKIIPEWINELEGYKLKKAIFVLNKLIIRNRTFIPKYINSYEELLFYYKMNVKKIFPLLIDSKEKFNEYYNLIKKIDIINGIEELKTKNILPYWINSYQNAFNYIWMEFSVLTKKWKESYDTFSIQFRYSYTRL